MTPSAWAIRRPAAVRKMPRRRAITGARADPAANAIHPAAATGPITTPARDRLSSSSANRIGMIVSNATMPKPHSADIAISALSAREARNRPMPSKTAFGTSLSEDARPEWVGLRSSFMRTKTLTTASDCATIEATIGTARASTPLNGCQAISPPAVSAPAPIASPMTDPPPARPLVMSASMSCRCASSTNHESSGPLSSAR